MIICDDAGHGGRFAGSTGYDGSLEKNENLTNAKMFRDEMERRGHTVIMTREADIDFSPDLGDDLMARVEIANKAKADCFISWHENWYEDSGATGIETIYTSHNPSQKSIQWANDCLSSMVAAMGLRRRGTLQQGITVLRYTDMPAILIEPGFMSNKNDLETIRAKRRALIMSVADSCEAIFGQAIKPAPVDPFAYELAADAPLYRYVGKGKKGTKIELGAYPIAEERPIIDGDENGVLARIEDKNGDIYLVPWVYLKKIG